MKAKYFIIYAVVGAAFLAVSLWVFLSGGKNAKAIRAKYRLGGIVLMAWSMLSVASCENGPFEVTCYDPIPVDYVSYESKNHDDKYRCVLSPGDVLEVEIMFPAYGKYRIVISKYDGEYVGDALQTEEISVQLNKTYQHNLVYTPSDTEYSGLAELTVLGISEEYPDGNEIFSAHVLSITPVEE